LILLNGDVTLLNMVRNYKHGFSLLELLLVVSVGAVLILAGLLIYRNVSSNARIVEAQRTLIALQSELENLFDNQPSYGTTVVEPLNSVVINSKLIPEKNINGGNLTILGNYELFVETSGSTDSNYRIRIEGLSTEDCINLIPTFAYGYKGLNRCNVGGTHLNGANCNLQNIIEECGTRDGSNGGPGMFFWRFD